MERGDKVISAQRQEMDARRDDVLAAWKATVGYADSAVSAAVLLSKKTARSHIRKVRQAPLLFATDLVSACFALSFAFVARYGLEQVRASPELIETLLFAGPQYLAICIVVFPMAGLYSRNWRYGSISDLWTILRAVLITTALLVCVLFFITRLDDIPRAALLLEALLLSLFLSASRLSFRINELSLPDNAGWLKQAPEQEQKIPTLLVGAGDAADLYLRAVSRDRSCFHRPVAIIEPTGACEGIMLHGVPILGALADFERVVRELRLSNSFPRHLVFTEAPSVFGEEVCEKLIRQAEALGIAVSRLSQMTELKNAKRGNRFELKSIELTDLLERPQAALDRDAILRLIRGRRVLITGAGGSIGSELTLQIAACEPSHLVLVENCEFNLYTIDLELAERFATLPRATCLCNVRRANRVNDVFEEYRPELVFHAAALKHVPMVEINPCEGALTNVIGTMNVANAARQIGALAMVQISTDKVVNPTSVMGGTKRLAELYCQALDLEGVERGSGPRYMTVRFGNVLGSSGSLIPLFKRQIASGGPLTVTDPDMTRFFMTIREAVELTLQASAYGLEGDIGKGEIFVLDMGKPVKIMDIARRMIRLAGLVPDKDIAIKVIGLRPGEKCYEELFDMNDTPVPSPVPGVFGAIPRPVPLSKLRTTFARLERFAELGDASMVLALISSLVPGYAWQRPAFAGAGLAPMHDGTREEGEDHDVGLPDNLLAALVAETDGGSTEVSGWISPSRLQ
ncbi:polysaccharide biosynthesis protein [Rhizobium mongolense]|uniref:polysaccharide biosynthesis protein n=1 Tax=Rhizobium mongolense TaxID=57676 RepID=UPI0035563F47